MNPKHRKILDKIEEYLKKPGASKLRFWQALYNMDVITYQTPMKKEVIDIQDDYNISDEILLKRIK